MDTKQLKSYAPEARKDFIEAITNRAATYGLLPDEVLPMEESGDVVIIGDQAFPRAVANQRRDLETRISEQGFEQFIEAVAYTWFNRLVAIRYMEVHGYLDHGYRVLSHPADESLPEVMEYAERLNLPGLDADTVIEMKLDGQKDGELYRLILVAQCNALHRLMPFMFGGVSDATVLLLPDNLLNTESVVRKLVKGLPAESLEDVEAVGWLYQFYISEKKDDVFEALKKKKTKITPENIPAATQLFTPHWIVRYLVENSLGRLWMQNHPDSLLIEKMDYYIKSDELDTDFLPIAKPEEIRICDPACGSGHMLTYAFELLYVIYEEQGYRATDIPKLIFQNNLYGIEIDDRAGALAAFVLTMKAREKNKRFLSPDKVVQPNICILDNISINPESLEAYIDKVGRDLFSNALQEVVNQWDEAKNFGSLIRPRATDVSDVLEQLHSAGVGEDLFLNETHKYVLKALKQADYLTPKYQIVIANPPYMSAKGMSPQLKSYVGKHYPSGRPDAFSAFMIHCLELTSSHCAMVTPYVWMFLSSYEELREHLLNASTISSLVQLEYNAFEPACVPVCAFLLEKGKSENREGDFIGLSNFKGHWNQGPRTLEAIKNRDCGWRFQSSGKDFRTIPGSPIAYWATKSQRSAFESGRLLGEIASPKQGIATADNARFLRRWHEVAFKNIHFGLQGIEEAVEQNAKWLPYNKGGGFRKWYGNNEFVINWENNGAEVRGFCDDDGKQRSAIRNPDFFFRPSATWTDISSSSFGVRRSDRGFLFDGSSHSAFPPESDLDFITGLLCACTSFEFLKIINPTMHFQVGNIASIPVIEERLYPQKSFISDIAQRQVTATRNDWDSFETSWGFQTSPISNLQSEQSVAKAYQRVRKHWHGVTQTTHKLDEENNRLFVDAYGMNDEFTSKIPLEQVTLNWNPAYRYDSNKSEAELEAFLLADTMRELISYAVGCMLGRYSLDKPGLILANQGETAGDYRQQIPEPTFAPDEDNVIPVLDGDWFDDDICERFKEFLKVTFDKEHFKENLAFLENSLYPDNETARTRKTILDYFTKDFFKQHMKMYKKRPIYWMFSSGKQGAFRALVYMHRYNPSTLSRMRTAYVVPLQGKYNSRIDQLANDIPAATNTSHRKQLEKEHASFIKKRDELQTFDEKLRHYADQRIEIDLDDGVKENYSKFGDLLAGVKDITGKKPVDLTASKNA